MTIEQDLSALWRDTVRSGAIANQFRGKDGRPVEIGLRLVNESIQHYAKYSDTGEMIGASIQERQLPGSNFAIEWNQYRALKPHIRVTRPGPQPDISSGVDQCLFACRDKTHPLTILKREPLMQLALPGAKWIAFYNAVPVEAKGHFLWVPVQWEAGRRTYPHQLQELDESLVRDFVALAEASSGTATLYNSLHAGASVNHIHFHSVHDGRTAALRAAPVIQIGRHQFLKEYPATGLVFNVRESPERLWEAIRIFQQNRVPLNMVAVTRQVYLFPRRSEHEAVTEFPDGVIACAELSGKLITTREDYFKTVSWEQVRRALAKTCLSAEEIVNLLGS